jgi:predicted glycogen debranching enzyme
MEVITRIGWRRGGDAPREALIDREWLVTNALGGYASGTIAGAVTRRYHGLLIAALPTPLGRTMMFDHLSEQLRLPDSSVVRLGAEEREDRLALFGAEHLQEFRLEMGLPVWIFRVGAYVIEKRLFLGHMQNTVYVMYRVREGEGMLRLSLRPAVHFRPHHARVDEMSAPYTVSLTEDRFELRSDSHVPPLRMRVVGRTTTFVFEPIRQDQISYRREADRGYEARGELSSHGYFRMLIGPDSPAALVASTEPWETMAGMEPITAHHYELERRRRLVNLPVEGVHDPIARELVLAADQFLISPTGRVEDATRARAEGEELRSVVAGYHWFTDWGRDTMISLEGLTLCTNRHQEARWILNTFAHYVQDGLIPNQFPDGAREAVYNTADATLWYFHALDRYLHYTGDRGTLRLLLPTLETILEAHFRGTRFGIRMDAEDGLVAQGQEEYALTWMDAKCDDWVVTPRRGKSVEINALWYNALVLMARWMTQERGAEAGARYQTLAEQVHQSFNQTFWYESGGYLYDVIDLSAGLRDTAFRPNQIFAISLPNPVLAEERWAPVLDRVRERLLTPFGLRSLAPDHPDFKPTYHGDLRTRDAAYHQGTVWSWLIGPFADAWLKVHAGDRAKVRGFLGQLCEHLGDCCIGSVSEVFDAEAPFRARGCVAQAWGVAELLRVWLLSEDKERSS